jgi:predicted ribonuclease YlaK
LLHYRPVDEVDWTAVAGAKAVRLVVPLRVVEELDEKKYARRGELGDRAVTRLRKLEQHTVASGPRNLRPGLEIEILASVNLDPEAARRPAIPADTEILDTCEALSGYSGGNAVFLVTGDLAMKIRAQTRGLDARQMPDEYRVATGGSAAASTRS